MKRLKIMKSYMVLWLFIYFLIYSNLDAISTFFMATLTFNLAVVTILTIGIIMIMKASISLVMLAGTFGTMAYKKDNLSFYLKGIEKIMPANIAHMFHSRAEKGVMLFTVDESRAVIDWIDEKFSNQNRYTNYFIGTVLMIGLLGTFSGLLIAIDDMGRIILSLSGDIDLGKVISDFSGPLSGMAVGFGSSLFGVIAAIIMGLKGYILNKNQEILIEGVEDWLKGRIVDVGGGGSAPAMAGVPTQNTLPGQNSSFIEIFVETIGGMTAEMKAISQTNERLHSITIASVQQARDEHDITVSVLEEIHKTLQEQNGSENNIGALNNNIANLIERVNEGNSIAQGEADHIEQIESAQKYSANALHKQNTLLNNIQQLLDASRKNSTTQTKSVLEKIDETTQAIENIEINVSSNNIQSEPRSGFLNKIFK